MHYYQNYTTVNDTGQTITANFIAGEVSTKKDFSYGIFECNANFAYDKGSFPAFWLYNDTSCYSSSRPEIDIVECKVHHANPTLDNHIFYYPLNCGPYEGYEFARHDFTWGGTYTFKCIWTPSKIEFWVDNTLKKTVTNTGQFWYPSLKQHVVLSQQVTRYGIRIPGTDEIINPSTNEIVIPQTSSFDWVKVREFFLAPEISFPDIICSTDTAIIDVDSSALNFTWSLTPTNLFSGDKTGTGKNVTIIPATGASGQGKITYTFKMPSGEQFEAEKTFWVGKPAITNISGPLYAPNNQWATYYAEPNNYMMAATDYNWILNPLNGNVVYDYGWTADIAFYNSGTYQLLAQAYNTCGWSSYYVAGVEVYDNQGLSISPNPTTGETTLTIETTSIEKSFDENAEWDLEIYDQIQTLKEKKTKIKGKEYKLQTTGWKEGVYFVRVKYKDKVLTSQLVVQQ